MTLFLVTYILKGKKTCKEVFAKDAIDAKFQIYEMENATSKDITILSAETWELYEEMVSLFNA